MKRIATWFSVTLVLVLIAFAVARADTRRRIGWCGHRWHHPGSRSFLAEELKLNDAQVVQIRTVWEAERPKLSAQIRELLAENREMDALAAQENPDESRIQEIAGSEAAQIAELMVEKERLQWKIYGTILNRAQRSKAAELQRKWESRLDRLAEQQPETK